MAEGEAQITVVVEERLEQLNHDMFRHFVDGGCHDDCMVCAKPETD